MLINISNIEYSELKLKPYKHAIINHVIDLENVNSLLTELPLDSFISVSREMGSDKTYKVDNHIIYPLQDQKPCSTLTKIWLSLIEELTSDTYKSAISKLIEYDVSKTYIEITLKRYKVNDYISPHTDREIVPVTHVIFLNPKWDKQWGGEFCIHDGDASIAQEIIPTFDKSILFKQSAQSWHSVNQCLSADHHRIGLQVAFWNSQEKIVYPGRQEIGYEF